MRGVNIGLKLPKVRHYLQLLDKSGGWVDLMPIDACGKKVNRGGKTVMRISYEDAQLVVEDSGSLNGLYLRNTQPVELHDGMRIRIGNYVIEFRTADPLDPVEPLRSDDGEEFCSRELEALANLDLIRPNGRPGLRFPITMPELIIGREKEKSEANITLPGDTLVSGRHAKISSRGGKFFLEDLQSTNGTYVQILGTSPVKSGDEILAGHVLFRVVDRAGV